jgi:NAD(P)-dependent dehydrogenase (short-subunit alcohol dehydrogenase family)
MQSCGCATNPFPSIDSFQKVKNVSKALRIMTKLDGKIAVITGGNSGIGLATALRFVAEDAYVFIIGRRQSELDEAARLIGKNVTAVQGDVSNLADLDRLYAIVKEQKGRIDILFANAAVGEFATLAAVTEEHFDKTFGINVKALLFTVQKALPLISDGGSIILTSSTAASKGIEGFSVYSATKAAVRSFARSWTVDLKQRKIRVNAISPGPIDTLASRLSLRAFVQNEQQGEQLRKKLVTTVPLGRMGSPDEIAKVASFLASDESSYVTGIEFFVDGGQAQI